MQIFKFLWLITLSVLLFFGGAVLFTSKDQVLMGTSILGSNLHGVANDGSKYDISIGHVDLTKSTKEASNSTNFSLSVDVENIGDEIKYQQVLLKIAPLNEILVLSKPDGNFYLKTGETLTIEKAFSLPSGVAEQSINISISPLSFVDQNLENNSRNLVLKEDVTAINNFRVFSAQEDGILALSWDKSTTSGYDYSLMMASSDKILLNGGTEYFETTESSYVYQKVSFSHKLLKEWDFKPVDLNDSSFSLPWNPWNTSKYSLIVLQATNTTDQSKIFSDFIYLTPAQKLTKAEMARTLVQKLQLQTNDNAVHFFEDVTDEDWFSPYVKSLYAAGALEGTAKFRPNEMATRRDLAKILNNLFQLSYDDLREFDDVRKEDPDYYSMSSLKNYLPIWGERENFLPEDPVLLETVNSVIDQLKSKAEIY